MIIFLGDAGDPPRILDDVRRRVRVRGLAPTLVPAGGQLPRLLEVSREPGQTRYIQAHETQDI